MGSSENRILIRRAGYLSELLKNGMKQSSQSLKRSSEILDLSFQTTPLISSPLFTPRLKKCLQNGFAFVFQDAAFDCRVFVQQRVGKQIDNAARRAGFGFCRAVDDAADAGLNDGGGAHGAGFERDVEVATVEAVVLKGGTCGGKGADFGVAADVVVADAGVVGGAMICLLETTTAPTGISPMRADCSACTKAARMKVSISDDVGKTATGGWFLRACSKAVFCVCGSSCGLMPSSKASSCQSVLRVTVSPAALSSRKAWTEPVQRSSSMLRMPRDCRAAKVCGATGGVVNRVGMAF